MASTDSYEYHPISYTSTSSTLNSSNSTIQPHLTAINTLLTQLPPPTDTLKSTPLPPHAQIDRSLLPMIQASQYLGAQRQVAEKSAEARKAAENLLNKSTNNDPAALEKVISHCDESVRISEARPPWERVFIIDEVAAAIAVRSITYLRLRRFTDAVVDARLCIALKAAIPENSPSAQQKRLALPYFAGAKALQEMRRIQEARQWAQEGLAIDGPQLETLNKQIRALMENKWVVAQQGNQQQIMSQQGRQEIQGRYQAWSREVENLKKLAKELEE